MDKIGELTKDLICLTKTKAHAILLHELFVLLCSLSSHVCKCDKIIKTSIEPMFVTVKVVMG